MRHVARCCRIAAIAVAAVMIGSAPVSAGDSTPPSLDDEALDAIRELVPEGEPGEYDLEGADELYEQLGTLLNVDAQVDDFGDSSALTGPCGGFAFSYDKGGDRIDAAFDAGDDAPPVDLLDGGQAFTSGNPFKVDTQGVVVYYGFSPRSGDGPRNHRWSITTSGISLDSGGDPNDLGNNRNAGLVDLGDDLPVPFAAKVKISGEMSSDNLAACIGNGHVDLQAPFANPLTLGSIVVLGGGVLGLLFNARPARTWKA
jgi:hypothetical protein